MVSSEVNHFLSERKKATSMMDGQKYKRKQKDSFLHIVKVAQLLHSQSHLLKLLKTIKNKNKRKLYASNTVGLCYQK